MLPALMVGDDPLLELDGGEEGNNGPDDLLFSGNGVRRPRDGDLWVRKIGAGGDVGE